MKFSVTEVEYEEQWGYDSREDKEFTTLEELVEFVKEVQDDNGYIYRFVIYDPARPPHEEYTGYITIAPSEE